MLDIALKWSVFCYDIVGNRDKAITVGRAAHSAIPIQRRSSLSSTQELTPEEKEIADLVNAITHNLGQWEAEAQSVNRYESPSATPRTSFSEIRPRKRSTDHTMLKRDSVTLSRSDSAIDAD